MDLHLEHAGKPPDRPKTPPPGELHRWYQEFIVEGAAAGPVVADDDGTADTELPAKPPSGPPSLDTIREAYGIAHGWQTEPVDPAHTAHTSMLHRLRHKCGWSH